MKTVLLFLLLVFFSGRIFAKELVVSPLIQREEITSQEGCILRIWETFEFEITNSTKGELSLFSHGSEYFAATFVVSESKTVFKTSPPDWFELGKDFFVQEVKEQSTGKRSLRLKFVFGVLPKSSEMRVKF